MDEPFDNTQDKFEKAYNRTLRFLSYRPRSEKEIKDFLRKSARGRSSSGRKADPEIVEKILNKLKELNLVNDEEFAKWWIEQRTGAKPRGLLLIKIELRQKGISEEIIETIIHNSEFIIQNESELAKRALHKKLKSLKQLAQEQFRQKASAFLFRRGFDFETSKVAIDEMLKKGL